MKKTATTQNNIVARPCSRAWLLSLENINFITPKSRKLVEYLLLPSYTCPYLGRPLNFLVNQEVEDGQE